jgi:hypothetical protein
LTAEMIPIGMPTITHNTAAPSVSDSVAGSRSTISCPTGTL